jgi:hypothetical protein
MKRKLMAALAASAMLGVLWTASPASADKPVPPPGNSGCSFSAAPTGEPLLEGGNIGEIVRSFRDTFGGPPPFEAWFRPGETGPLNEFSGRPAVATFCNPNGPK